MLIQVECRKCEGEGCFECANRGFFLVGIDPETYFGRPERKVRVGAEKELVVESEGAGHEDPAPTPKDEHNCK